MNAIEKLNAQIEGLKNQIKIIENYNVMVEFFENREKFNFNTYTGIKGLWSNYYSKQGNFWSCGEIQFSEVKSYKEIYKIMNDQPLKNKEIERFIKAENFIKKALKEDKNNTMNLLYTLEN